MRRASLAFVVLAVAGVLAGCRGAKPEPPKPPPPHVTVVQPANVLVHDYWLYNGYLEQTKAAEVRSKVRGYLLKVDFKEGTEVAAGDLLYSIDKVEFQTAYAKADAEEKKAAAEIKNWEAQIVQAKADLERISKAVASGGESKTELDKAQATHDVRIAERDAAIANHGAAKAALHTAEIQLGYTDIKAKIGGRISRTQVDEGTLVQADTTLLTTILKVDELYVYFDAPETDLKAYLKTVYASEDRGGPRREIPVDVGVLDDIGYPHRGSIDFRENKVENTTGTIRLRGRIQNPPMAPKEHLPARWALKFALSWWLEHPQLPPQEHLLVPGLYARVRLPRGEPTMQLTLPEDCLLSAQEGRFVFVVGADGMVEKRVVTVGASVWKAPPMIPGVVAPSWVAINPTPTPPAEGQSPAPTRRPIQSIVAITAGLLPGDRVILDGLQQARPGATVSPEEWNLTPPASPTLKP